jgi:hypothetical protein
LSLYLDASVLIAMFIAENRSPDAHHGILGNSVIVSDFAIAEASAGVARRQRRGEISASDATHLFSTLDAWIARCAQRAPLENSDVLSAVGLVRRLDRGLRAPDAINIAIAQRLNATLFTFDRTMAATAIAMGLTVRT